MINLKDSQLAINGGKRFRTKPWFDNYTISEEEKTAVIEVLNSGYLSKFEGSFTPTPPFSFEGGPFVRQLEDDWCDYYNIRYAISMNSATSCLYAALGALKIGYGDEVIVSPSTMTASAVGPLIYGAIPIFADIERKTGCLDPKSIEKLITPNTKCILVVHLYGIPADMDPIMRLAKKHNIKVIEDCAQAHGAKYKGRNVGTIGDIGVFSLNVNKTIQSGEGGLCITESEDLKLRLQLIRNHGENVVGPASYNDILNIIGYNYRLTEIQAAIAIEQLKKLNVLNNTRIEYVEYLNDRLQQLPFLECIYGRENCISTYYQYPILFNSKKAGVSQQHFIKAINAEGVHFFPGYTPLYYQPEMDNQDSG